jgi:hypothetical protein
LYLIRPSVAIGKAAIVRLMRDLLANSGPIAPKSPTYHSRHPNIATKDSEQALAKAPKRRAGQRDLDADRIEGYTW